MVIGSKAGIKAEECVGALILCSGRRAGQGNSTRDWDQELDIVSKV